ncbi:hypothetical protein GOBAR_AA24907 [Gossypium barbadense]|uniref:Transposase Tnp1/En/Spm-like domain-containing protein n=1 Tax=Gossypium barbadense TaxID=3634 RepID=A0A2P5WXH3_GOSBA|nr:hypothetical protein GOBAR_AA24907 [Gossypium barbadense]
MRRRRLRDLSIVQNTSNSEEGNSKQQTVVGSSNVPETLDEPEEFQTKIGKTRRVRGRTLLRDLYDLDPVERVKERFALEVSDDYIKKALGKRWRDNKSTLKKQYFKKDISLEEKLRNVPPGMLRYQWEDAVRFWNSKKGEDREQVGTSSRQKQKFTHTAGSRSFAFVAEAKEVKSGQKVGRLQLFEITHRKKYGSPMTSEAGEIMEKLKEKKAEYEAIASSDNFVNLENIDNRIITEVLGPESNTCLPKVKLKLKFRGLRDQIAQMQANTVEQIAEVQRKYEELQQQLRAEAAKREAAAAAREAEARAMGLKYSTGFGTYSWSTRNTQPQCFGKHMVNSQGTSNSKFSTTSSSSTIPTGRQCAREMHVDILSDQDVIDNLPPAMKLAWLGLISLTMIRLRLDNLVEHRT